MKKFPFVDIAPHALAILGFAAPLFASSALAQDASQATATAAEPSVEAPVPVAAPEPVGAASVGAAPVGPAAVADPAPAAGVAAVAPPAEPPKAAWYEKISIRGYSQFRYNRFPTFNDNDKLVNTQGDRTIGPGNGFSLRRARLIVYGDVHEHVAIYIQPDFASTIDTQLHVAILRDWYSDIFFDKKREFRLRIGQSKVPYGFENLQSSQNRLPLDRNDALNSAVKDERDIGAFLYWAPEEIRARFKHLVDGNLKGSGDYGVVGLGVYNGQTANKPALSDDLHVIGRVTWPFKFGEQFVEIGGGGYFGKYYVERGAKDSATDRFKYTLDRGKVRDARVHATIVVYPQPFGFVAEGTYGVGPSLGDRGAADADEIKARKLVGGYAQLMYKADDVLGTVALIPFVRGTYYDGGRKFEKDAPHYVIKELELGVEWQIIKNFEIVAAYDMAERTAPKAPFTQERGHVARMQLQVNY